MGENRSIEYVSQYTHEADMARNERTIKRLIIALIIAFVLIFGTNAVWLYAWMQYDYVSTEDSSTEIELHADGDSNANYIGESGDINN